MITTELKKAKPKLKPFEVFRLSWNNRPAAKRVDGYNSAPPDSPHLIDVGLFHLGAFHLSWRKRPAGRAVQCYEQILGFSFSNTTRAAPWLATVQFT